MAIYLPIQAISRSQNVRVGSQHVVPGSTFYVDISNGNTRRDLQHHSAVGAYIVVGPISATSSDFVVVSGGATTAGTGLSVNVSAGEMEQRSTGTRVTGASGTNVATADTTSAGQSIMYLIVWDDTSGAVSAVAGTPATTGAEALPAIPSGKTPLASVDFAHGAAAPTTIVDLRPRP